jgi:hypothetical protein
MTTTRKRGRPRKIDTSCHDCHALTLKLREAERDYRDVVLSNYRLVRWIKDMKLTVPTTGELKEKYPTFRWDL